MAKAKEFENILDECLDRLIKGETIESCLARYPGYSAELEPLLKTAQEARLAASVKPRPEFRQRAAGEFQAAIRNLPVKKGGNASRWQVRWVAPVAAILVLLTGGSGTVYAATNALPDSPLYQVKLAAESVQMAFTFSDSGKAELYAKFIDYRVEEIVCMAEDGNAVQVAQTTVHMNDQLVAMADNNLNNLNTAAQGGKAGTFGLMTANGETATPPLSTPAPTTSATTAPSINMGAAAATPNTPTTDKPVPPVVLTEPTQEGRSDNSAVAELSDIDKLKLMLQEKLDKNLQILKEHLAKAPEALKPALQQAIDVMENGYSQAISNLG